MRHKFTALPQPLFMHIHFYPHAAGSTLLPMKISRINSTVRIISFLSAPLLIAALAMNGAQAAPTSKPGQANPAYQPDPAQQAAMKKYQDCLAATGVTLPQFGRGGFGRGAGANNGARPTGAPTARPTNFPQANRPTLTPEQQAALDKCAPLRPAFGRGGFKPDGFKPDGVNPSAGPVIKKKPSNAPVKPVAPAKPVAPVQPGKKVGAPYIACLNSNGVNVKSSSDIAGLDQQSPKIAAALAKCANKK